MALAAMLQIDHVTQREARMMISAIDSGTITVMEMLWVQCCYVPTHPEPWTAGWRALLNRFVEVDRVGSDGSKPEEEEIWPSVENLINRNRGSAAMRATLQEMITARSTPLTREEPEAMHEFAAIWREYVTARNAKDTDASRALRETHGEYLTIRTSYQLHDRQP